MIVESAMTEQREIRGTSPGTKHALAFANKLGKLVYLEVAKPEQEAA
jgi:hypothetical protein